MMKRMLRVRAAVAAVLSMAFIGTGCAGDEITGGRDRNTGGKADEAGGASKTPSNVQLGARPYFLINDLPEGELKSKLLSCSEGPFQKTDFSIGHRGASQQFPEHTKESYEAAARMGAGIVECDVTFTKDLELVCRHSQCDLQSSTNILGIPELAAKCTIPFSPADPATGKEAEAKCCTSDITLAEFKTLCGKMDAFNPDATTVEEYMNATPGWRTDLYSECGTVMSHAESVRLFKQLGVKMTPELKLPDPDLKMPFGDGFTQEKYAQSLIDELESLDVDPKDVFVQSFHPGDVRQWIRNNPEYADQAVFLDEDEVLLNQDGKTALPRLKGLFAEGVRIYSPPLWALLTLDVDGKIVPSSYADALKEAGLKILPWSLERSGPLKDGGGWYYQTMTDSIDRDSDMLEVLDVLATKVGIIGMFSDWAATVTYYANCMGL